MQHRWIDPTEHASVVSTLLRYGLLKFSNKRDLPLKKGGTTDIYVNLRDARNHPEALTAIAKLYEHPIRKIGPDRFVEVPDSVSCFAPIIATRTGLPYLTIREEPKEGRVSKSTMIGTPRPGERVCIIDDVITDGASKIEPRRGCILADLVPEQLVVLVDRQQGWQEMFRSHDVDLPVWAGMTLHEVRRQLIESGAMERCDKKVEQANPIVVALDGK